MITRYVLMHIAVQLPSEKIAVENHMVTVPYTVKIETFLKMMESLTSSGECEAFAKGIKDNG